MTKFKNFSLLYIFSLFWIVVEKISQIFAFAFRANATIKMNCCRLPFTAENIGNVKRVHYRNSLHVTH